MWTLAACATLYATFATGVLTWWLSGCALTLPPISDFGLSGDGAPTVFQVGLTVAGVQIVVAQLRTHAARRALLRFAGGALGHRAANHLSGALGVLNGVALVGVGWAPWHSHIYWHIASAVTIFVTAFPAALASDVVLRRIGRAPALAALESAPWRARRRAHKFVLVVMAIGDALLFGAGDMQRRQLGPWKGVPRMMEVYKRDFDDGRDTTAAAVQAHCETPWATPSSVIFLGEWVYVLSVVLALGISYADVLLHESAAAKGLLVKRRSQNGRAARPPPSQAPRRSPRRARRSASPRR